MKLFSRLTCWNALKKKSFGYSIFPCLSGRQASFRYSIISIFFTLPSFSQTTLVNPSGDGGFELGNTFALNGWTVVNGAQTNKWFVGTIPPGLTGTYCSYISSNGTGNTNNYNGNSSSVVHFYKDISFPAGSPYIFLLFDWKGVGETNQDYLRVFLVPTTTTPAAGTALGAGQIGITYGLHTAWQKTMIALPCAGIAGTTQRLVFSWRNNGSVGNNPAIAVENISVVAYSSPPSCTSFLGTGITVVPSLPYSSGAGTTCGSVNDLTPTNVPLCGPGNYLQGEDLVWIVTPLTSGIVTVTLASSGSNTGIKVYNGCPLTGGCIITQGSCVANSGSTTGNKNFCFSVIAGNTYYIILDSNQPPACNAFSDLTISAPVASTGNTCANSVNIVSLPYSVSNESTACFGNDYTNASAGSCGSLYESGEDKVYRYIAAGPECISVTLSGTSTNSIGFQVYSGCPGTAGTVCLGNYGGAVSGTLSGSVNLPSAGTYYIIVDTWSSPFNASYNISVSSFGTGAANDLPCNAQAMALGVGYTGNNNCSGSASEPAAPGCWVPGTVNSVWYSAVAPASGQLRIRTAAGSLKYTQIAIYSGACNSLTYISCNDDAQGCGNVLYPTYTYTSDLLVTGLTPGNTYFIVVDGEANFTGSFGIMVTDGLLPLPSVYGQECILPMPVCTQSISVGDPGYQDFGNYCDFPGASGNCLLTGERGSAWYEIFILNNGTLNFDIIPNDWPGAPSTAGTDYDFAIWQVSTDVATTCAAIGSGSVPLKCNYDLLGVTGLSPSGNSPAAYPGFNLAYETELVVSAGDIYLLNVSNFSNSASGFTMIFNVTSPINYTPSPGTVVWSGGIDNDWFKAENWGGCAIPNCTTSAVISSAPANQPIIYSAGATCKSIDINAGASLSINSGFTLTVCQDYKNSGTLNAAANSTVLFNNGAVNQYLDGNMIGTSRFNNVTVNKTGGIVQLLQDADMSGNFLVSNGTSSLDANGKYHRVAGNFTIFGSYIPAGGMLEMYGSSTQTYFNTGTVNNFMMTHSGAGVTLASHLTIGTGGTLILTNGKIITTPSYETRVLNTNPASVTTGNVNSYVEGFLRRNLSALGSFDFPVGNAAKGYQRANVNFVTPTLISDLVASFSDYSALPGPIGGSECGVTYSQNALDNGYWTITASNNPSSGDYNMTLYNRSYTNASGTFWTVMKDPGSGWGLYNGTCIASPVTAVVRNTMNGFSDFGTAQGTAPLPVEWLSFEANEKTKTILLEWSTASEKNNAGFEIQRGTTAFDFKKTGWKTGKGTTTTVSSYSFEDATVIPGVVYYYRLKQIDFDGKEKYSPVVSTSLRFGNELNFSAIPNPYKDFTTVSYYLNSSSYISLTVMNSIGQVVKTMHHGAQEKGAYQYRFSATGEGFAKGFYTLRLMVDEKTFSLRLLEVE